MDDPEIIWVTFNQLDIDFHVELAEAGNRLMRDMTRAPYANEYRCRFWLP